ncbi:hypothetical protein JZ00_14505 [Pseudomonas frederiksbergensis]|uniref:Uncharacterized protein n=1 Tax=Pseudomonas frederiksbergensis TaxID=104087 RepID=A0A0B1Z3A1_9PSED|nr:hypothetical protein JZ00_14505 [Pseudomonas frederiksbergensis]
MMIHAALKNAILTDEQGKSAPACIASVYKGVYSQPMEGQDKGASLGFQNPGFVFALAVV